MTLVAGRPVVAADLVWPVPEWQIAKSEEEGMNAAGVAKVGELLKASGAKTGLVIRHGKIVGEWYFDGAGADTKLLVYSTSKSFASTAAGLAVADGKLGLDSKVGDFLPDVKPEGKRDITVRQLISMSTGVHNNNQLPTMEKRFSYALFEAPMDHKPGAHWDYNNTGLAILAPVLKKATGKQVDEDPQREGLRQDRNRRKRLDLGQERRLQPAVQRSAYHGPRAGEIRLTVPAQRPMAGPASRAERLGDRGGEAVAREQRRIWLPMVEQHDRQEIPRRADRCLCRTGSVREQHAGRAELRPDRCSPNRRRFAAESQVRHERDF
ncbi:MAG: serine hydrolase domain-containing protein [Pirellulales bacterium]